MNIRPPRILLTVNMAVFLLVCMAFLLHYLGIGLYPEPMQAWLDDNRWLMWTAAALTVGSAIGVAPLNLIAQQPAEDARRRGVDR